MNIDQVLEIPQYQNVADLNPIRATLASPRTSFKYVFLPTTKVIEVLTALGMTLFDSKVCKARKHKGYQKHYLRFRFPGALMVGDSVPEVLVKNSHDGLSSLELRLGVYRLVCSNGLVVGNDRFIHRITHKGDAVASLKDGVTRLMGMIEDLKVAQARWVQCELNEAQAFSFAHRALGIRLEYTSTKDGTGKKAVIPMDTVHTLLIPRREEDRGYSAWAVFNRVQERVMQGGNKYLLPTGPEGAPAFHSTRRLSSPAVSQDVNAALWRAMEETVI